MNADIYFWNIEITLCLFSIEGIFMYRVFTSYIVGTHYQSSVSFYIFYKVIELILSLLCCINLNPLWVLSSLHNAPKSTWLPGVNKTKNAPSAKSYKFACREILTTRVCISVHRPFALNNTLNIDVFIIQGWRLVKI